ncbi:MAG: nucleotidyl transferase AbiEii/AbiGii toxin family protein [Acidobacteriia bacterium]|nr:nucleotidyl transferase AbiEii/AbiGii toxin family protein [Terriglobia bacterium]MYK09277.1 nucleotidyl transferase AbiEii/AbiGii toxin family protein [Terriglobia bacterium]
MKSTRNLPASVRQRLLNRARSSRRPCSEFLQYFAMERFLYRLSRSKHSDRFILKGALMLQVWRSSEVRPTMDIDLLGKTDNEETGIVAQIRDILCVDVQPDGLTFDPASIRNDRISGDAECEGIRIRFQGALGTARVHMQTDIGFGDAVFPEPEAADLPAMLDFPAPRMLCYSRESTVAEKLEAMVKLGILNSRMKDFYDIWLLSRQFDFGGPDLSHAVRLTFERRGTALPAVIEAFTESFADDKQVQWSAFRNRLQQEHVPVSFAVVIAAIDEFPSPVVAGLVSGDPRPTQWTASGPWT